LPVTALLYLDSESCFVGAKKKNYSYCFAGPDFTLTDDRNGSFYFSNSISNAWKDSDLTVVPVVKKLVEAGLRIWIFR
jgi:hypothetical protein